MKFKSWKNGQVSLLLTLSVLVTGCNPDEYFPTQELIQGADAYCATAKSVDTCVQLTGCQAAYEDTTDESVTPTFAACVTNPDFVPPTDGSGSDGAEGGTGGSTGGSDGTGDPGAGGSTGGSTGGNGDGGSADTDPDELPAEAPTLDEAFASQCVDLDEKYLFVKTLITKKKSVTITKVKVCHSTSDGSSHTIVIACPALKAHSKHHNGEDYLGACATQH